MTIRMPGNRITGDHTATALAVREIPESTSGVHTGIARRVTEGADAGGWMGLLRVLMRLETKLDRLDAGVRALAKKDELPPMLTVREASDLLRRSPYTVRRWLREGRIEGTKASSGRGVQYLIPRRELESLTQQGDHDG